MRETLKVTFEPEGRSVYVLKGTNLIEAAGEAGIILNTPCGGQGTCGKCRVQITTGTPEASETDAKALSESELEAGYRLACQTKVQDSLVVFVPDDVRFFEQEILTHGVHRDVAIRPAVTKHHVCLEPATLENPIADADRLLLALKEAAPEAGIDLDVMRELPMRLRSGSDGVTVVYDADAKRIITIEEGDTTAENYGVAVDIGTTTVVGMLLDLNTGRQVAVAARTNPQVARGDDVISRITYVQENEQGLKELQETIAGCLNDIIGEVCEKAGIARTRIYEVTVVGNTTMGHIFLGIDPRHIAQAPYAAVYRKAVTTTASRAGLAIHEEGRVFAMPNIAGFVGGDTVGVILATDLMFSDEIRLALDIGTNGEMALGSKDRIIACSTAAGPAFEGARIRFGMRAAEGAVEKVVFNEDVEIRVIGNVPARGLCGTALIDTVAELLRVGVVDCMGKMLSPDEVPASVSDAIRRRVVPGSPGFDFVLVEGERTHNGEPVLLTQKDVREVQLAKGAISAGLSIIMKELGVTTDDIAEVLLAGAFGNFIRRSKAKRIGMIPDLPTQRIRCVGNAAGVGARMVLAARECRELAERISQNADYVELGGRPDFQMEFMNAMIFP